MAPHAHTVLGFFHYHPSRALAIVGLCCFLVISLVVSALNLKSRARFMVIVTLTGLCEMAGYACRIYMLHQPLYGVYVAMQCFLIISPTFLALVNYIVVGKLMQLFGTKHLAGLRPRWVSIFFFGTDLFSLAIQGAGAGLAVSPDGVSSPKSRTGNKLLLVGLGLQLGFFACYCFLTILLQFTERAAIKGRLGVPQIFSCLYITIVLLFIRNTYRVIEFAQGWYGSLATNETLFYIFDALLVFLCFVCYVLLHPGIFLRRAATAATLPVMQQHT